MNKRRKMWRGIHDEDYAHIGTQRGLIQSWEDSMRTRGGKFDYEWWYFDLVAEDNSSLVIVFNTVNLFKNKANNVPHVTVELTLANGEVLTSEYNETDEQFFFSTDKCYVKIGPNTLEGNLKDYTIHYENDEFTVDFELLGNIPSWRSETGYSFFNEKKRHYFAWLPAVPRGNAKASVVVGSDTYEIEGMAYHDHNWGNYPAPLLLHHWYWGRANIGEYTVISSYVTSRKWYRHKQFVSFVLAKGDVFIASNFNNQVKFIPKEQYTDPITGKPSHKEVTYEVSVDDKRYIITYHNEKTESAYLMTDKMQGSRKALLKFLGFKGSYARYFGKITLECYQGDELIEALDSHALWEQMYFGKPIRGMIYKID